MSESGPSRPNLLLIGAPRCASTALSVALGKHPDIFVCDPKEPHFLAMHGAERTIVGPGSERFDAPLQFDRERWTGLFEGREERYLTDASVTTITYPETSIPNIRRHCDPDVKLLVMLRNPVARAYSSYMYCVARGWNGGSFEQSLEEEAERIEANWQHLWFLRHLGLYEERLKPFQDAFPSENIFVIVAEEFSANPDAVLRDLYTFLDVPPVEIDASARINAGGQPRNTLIKDLSRFLHGNRFLRSTAKRFSSQAFRESVRDRSLVKVDMAPDTQAGLERFFAGTSEWAQDYLGRRLPGWS